MGGVPRFRNLKRYRTIPWCCIGAAIPMAADRPRLRSVIVSVRGVW
jgi:hypothetical protein